MSVENLRGNSESNLLPKLSVVARRISQMTILYTLLFLCPPQKQEGSPVSNEPPQNNIPNIVLDPPKKIHPAAPDVKKKESPDPEVRNPTLHFEKAVKTGEVLTEKFSQAKLHSASVEIDAAITEETKMIFAGESHWGSRPYYTQLIDKFIVPKNGVIFLESHADAQKALDGYIEGKQTFEDLRKECRGVVNWKHVIDHAKEKKVPVIFVDGSFRRDETMAYNIDMFMEKAKPDRGILFVGEAHLTSGYGDLNRVDPSIPEFMVKRGWKSQSMVDIHFHTFIDALYSCDSMVTRKKLWSIPHEGNISKAIHFSGEEDPISYGIQWISRLKNPATNKTVHAIVDSDRKLEGKGW